MKMQENGCHNCKKVIEDTSAGLTRAYCKDGLWDVDYPVTIPPQSAIEKIKNSFSCENWENKDGE